MSSLSPLHPSLLKPNDNRLQWGGLLGDSACLAISALAAKSQAPLLLITPDVNTASRWYQALLFFAATGDYPILHFPDWETLPFDHFSPHQDIISERLLTLYRLPRLQRGIVIIAMPTLMHRLCPVDYLEAHTFAVACDEKFPLAAHRERLIQAGYRAVGQVMEHGEFAQRGSIIDIYPMGSDLPYRIELFDETVESIRSFDPESQRSIEKYESIQLLPAREFPLNEAAITHFRQAWRAHFSGNPQQAPIYQQVSEGIAAAGVEYYLSLFFEKTDSFFDYLPKNTQIVQLNDLATAATQFWQETQHRYEQLRYDMTRPLCTPTEIIFTYEQINALLKNHQQIILQKNTGDAAAHVTFSTQLLPNILIDHKAAVPLKPLSDLVTQILQQQGRVLFCAESAGRRETLRDLLREINIQPTVFDSWQEFLAQPAAPIGICVAPLDQGFLFDAPPMALITESALFGEPVRTRRVIDERRVDSHLIIRNLTELRIGDPVVHLQHGVGRYLGLQTIKTGDLEAEYLSLSYADGDKIYVPVSSLHLISRYTGADPEHAPLQKLGSKQWDKIKEKTAKRIRDVAAELLDIYGRRQSEPGFAFRVADKEYQLFRSAFPFTETVDQQAVIRDVLKDMTSNRSMDRLVCGDVGFGKTEVAMQAAFVAIQNNKQVAVLVPTTLLAEQHGHNFQDRFADWPVRIAAISRLRTPQQKQEIIDALADGKIDIVIGTHKLLSPDIRFKNLGLLIVDEEHRFGVRQKERIKSLRAHVDVLTLTATPIPRTLNMALAGTRDLSIIATPPARRLSVKTFVQEYQASLVREAILRETMRGGQIYFLHNDVSTIEATALSLQKIVSEAKIAVAHGQMRERELERIMADFYHQKYNVLVCTTIIESGIDIPTANTIIINRADRFGLAQLHQLRGRVGRSHHQAYAYLLTPPWQALTPDAKKRLEAIAQLDQLGVGFNLATHDLEIRGAGELLGAEQSGHMHEVGFSLYMEMLEEAVAALKAGRDPALEKPLENSCEIDFGVSLLLPDSYVPDVNVRLTLYKRLTLCQNKEEMTRLKEELVDRFGPLPTAAQHLFMGAEIQKMAISLGIKKIDVGVKFGYLHFSEKPKINFDQLVTLVQRQPQQYQLQQDRLRFSMDPAFNQNRMTTVVDLLKLIN